MLLSNGIMVNDGKTWFSLNKNGEHCEMISAAECFIPIVSASPVYKYDGSPKSRFAVDNRIEFQPLERVVNELLEDDDEDMQTISHSDTYWEQKLPSNYEEIIKLSTYSLQWTTKKEIYFILCNGFLINDGQEWFSLAKNGKCHMLPARVAFNKSEWSWQSLPQSRFIEVAFHPHRSFWIYCRSNILSPQTKYATYLVYRLRKNQSEPLVKVSGGVFLGSPYSYEKNHSWYIYLLSPQTPIISGKFYETTHNPCNRAKMKGLPQQRNDGWMEVQLWEFRTGIRDAQIWANLRLTIYSNMPVKGLIVQGIEFKPI
ncbi:hypothetical protein L1887_14344 [Cichorium endivia]|nr:hypothetical protein L1887_14344 [Cichorium endivia]